MQIAKGTFLIGAPDDALQGLYSRSVILLCEHDVGGSFGLVINKPLHMDFPPELLSLNEVENPNVTLLSSGTLQPNQMILLHSNSTIPDQTLHVCEGVFLGGDLDFLQKEVSEASGAHLRLCFGYAAWGPGKLDKEVLSGAWFLCPASQQHVFETPAAKLWPTLLKEMGGKYAALSMIPEDLSLN